MTITLKISGVNTRSLYVNVTKKPIILGRSTNCTQAINDPKCSSTHCEVRLNENGETVIKDLGSKNGTIVNGCPIKEAPLYLGDLLVLGDTKLSLEATKMTSEEIQLHTGQIAKRKMPKIEGMTLELEEPIRRTVIASPSPTTKHDDVIEEERTLTNILKRIVDKIKS